MYRALIVEDHPQIALFLSSFLDMYDIQADYCADGNAGLLRAVADDYDFVLLDLRLPGLSGEAILHELALRKPSLPVIVTTGVANVAPLASPNVVAFLRKPFSLAQLRGAFSRLPATVA